MSLSKNTTNTTVTTGSGSATANYGFPSSSFTHQKQPAMPSDQKAKLLAMHRDGKANAGIYVAVVLVVYLILVIILLCRYAKRRRPTTLTDLGALDATTEQGRFPFLNIHRLTSCEGDGCFHSLTNSCYGKRSSAADATSSKSTSQNPDECGGGGNQELNSMTKCGKKEDDHIGKTNGNIEELNRNKNGENQQPLLHPLKEQPTGSTSVIEASSHPHDDSEENEDDSLEDD